MRSTNRSNPRLFTTRCHGCEHVLSAWTGALYLGHGFRLSPWQTVVSGYLLCPHCDEPRLSPLTYQVALLVQPSWHPRLQVFGRAA